MKPQRALRLRQAGRHRAHRRSDVDWVWRLGLARAMPRAFEMNCAPKHSDEPIQLPHYTMDYITGKTAWHPLPLPPVLRPHAFEDMTLLGYIDGPVQ